MLFNLLVKKKFDLERSNLYDILNSNIYFVNKNHLDDFNNKFFQLYQIEIFRPLLNVILTKIKNDELKFRIVPVKSWDRVAGHCITATTNQKEEESSFMKKNFTIMIKNIRPEIIIHEIGHAIEHIGHCDLNKDFRRVLASDTNGKQSKNIQLNACIKSILKDELKNYELEHIMSELFARFFEIIAISYEVDGWGKYQFKYKEAESFFQNTINWTKSSLIPVLNKQIDPEILRESNIFVKNLTPYKTIWTNNKIRSSKNSSVSNILNDPNKQSDAEVSEAIQSFEKWTETKQVHKLDNGAEYYIFGEKPIDRKKDNFLLLENKTNKS